MLQYLAFLSCISRFSDGLEVISKYNFTISPYFRHFPLTEITKLHHNICHGFFFAVNFMFVYISLVST